MRMRDLAPALNGRAGCVSRAAGRASDLAHRGGLISGSVFAEQVTVLQIWHMARDRA